MAAAEAEALDADGGGYIEQSDHDGKISVSEFEDGLAHLFLSHDPADPGTAMLGRTSSQRARLSAPRRCCQQRGECLSLRRPCARSQVTAASSDLGLPSGGVAWCARYRSRP